MRRDICITWFIAGYRSDVSEQPELGKLQTAIGRNRLVECGGCGGNSRNTQIATRHLSKESVCAHLN